MADVTYLCLSKFDLVCFAEDRRSVADSGWIDLWREHPWTILGLSSDPRNRIPSPPTGDGDPGNERIFAFKRRYDWFRPYLQIKKHLSGFESKVFSTLPRKLKLNRKSFVSHGKQKLNLKYFSFQKLNQKSFVLKIKDPSSWSISREHPINSSPAMFDQGSVGSPPRLVHRRDQRASVTTSSVLEVSQPRELKPSPSPCVHDPFAIARLDRDGR